MGTNSTGVLRRSLNKMAEYALAIPPTHRDKGHPMTIPFEKLKARLLANPNVKVEYDALAPEFKAAAEGLGKRSPDRAKCGPGE